MHIGLTGATGLAGYPVGKALLVAGHRLVTLGRRPSALGLPHRDWSLDASPDLSGLDALVHAAFSHEPGRYRGGEGDDPEGFLRLNRDGSLRLLDAAGTRRVVFLSSRAVYGAYPPGTRLSEEMPPRPDTLYGRMKSEVEDAMASANGISLRATGIYGPAPPGRRHKWADLFADFAAGRTVPSRAGTEVHAEDLGGAVRLAVELDRPADRVLNVSDIMLDRRDLLSTYARIAGLDGCLPARADPMAVSEMRTDRLRALGWRPRGIAGVAATLRQIVEAAP